MAAFLPMRCILVCWLVRFISNCSFYTVYRNVLLLLHILNVILWVWHILRIHLQSCFSMIPIINMKTGRSCEKLKRYLAEIFIFIEIFLVSEKHTCIYCHLPLFQKNHTFFKLLHLYLFAFYQFNLMIPWGDQRLHQEMHFSPLLKS